MISFIIPNYETSELTIKCIKSIFEKCNFEGNSKRIIIIDDCSSDKNIETLKKFIIFPPEWMDERYYDRVFIHTLKENGGVGNAINEGMKLNEDIENNGDFAENKYFIRLDNDTVFKQKDFDEKLIEPLKLDKSTGLVTAMTNRIMQPIQRISMPEPIMNNEKQLSDFLKASSKESITFHKGPRECFAGYCMAFRIKDMQEHKIKFNTETKILLEDNIFYMDVLQKMKKKCIIMKHLFIDHQYNGTRNLMDPKFIEEQRIKAAKIWEKRNTN